MTRFSLMAMVWAVLAAPAIAQTATESAGMLSDGTHIRAQDLTRLQSLEKAKADALAMADAGQPDQRKAAHSVLDDEALPADQIVGDTLAGTWRCRTIKIGGNLPAVAYPNFRCHVTADERGFTLTKETGSQRITGSFHRDGDRWVFLGVSYIAGDQPPAYSAFPEEMDTTATETLPSIGVLERTGPDTLRLILPYPFRESILDVLTLTR